MSKQFSVPTFFRKASNASLQDFFGKLGFDIDVRWGDITWHHLEPALVAFRELEPSQQNRAETAMRSISLLASTKGNECLFDAAELLGSRNYKSKIPMNATEHERAIWSWVYFPKVFSTAQRMFAIENTRWWRKRNDLPCEQPDLSEQALQRFGNAIINLLQNSDGRGQHCTIETMQTNEVMYVMAAPDNFHDRYEFHDKNGILRTRGFRPTFSIAFAFVPNSGTLEISMEGNAKLKEEFEKAFARELLCYQLTT